MKKSKLTKLLSTLLLGTTVMTFASPVVANAAWKKNSTGWWYTEGSSWATGWRQIGSLWYYFDNNGYMKTGWIQDKGTWYYLDNSGAMKTGWIKDDDGYNWYYTNGSGAMQTGWVYVNGAWYHLAKNGVMDRGWFVEKGNHYFLDEYTGAMHTGWYSQYKSETYYFDNNGVSASGATNINGKMYYFEEYNAGYRMARNTSIHGLYFGSDGVFKDGVSAKVTTEKQALDLINSQDSEFIQKVKSENSNIKMVYSHQTDDIRETMSLNNNPGIMDEGGFVVSVQECIDDYAKGKYVYVVGMLSGKVYISNMDELNVYEISNNKAVNSFRQKFPDFEHLFGTNNWR